VLGLLLFGLFVSVVGSSPFFLTRSFPLLFLPIGGDEDYGFFFLDRFHPPPHPARPSALLTLLVEEEGFTSTLGFPAHKNPPGGRQSSPTLSHDESALLWVSLSFDHGAFSLEHGACSLYFSPSLHASLNWNIFFYATVFLSFLPSSFE